MTGASPGSTGATTDRRTVPRLDAGLTVLDRPERGSTALHRLVLAELAEFGERGRRGTGRDEHHGTTFWLDARNEASTYALYDLAPSPNVLDGVQIARAFTAYQHNALVRQVARRAGPDTDLVVAPNVTSLYRDDDVPDWEAADLLASSLTILAELAAVLDVPVLVTGDATPAASDDDLLAEYADATVECVRTDAGLRYAADGFETTVYLDDGYWQTTIPYWVELFGAVTETDPATVARAAGLVDAPGDGPTRPGVETPEDRATLGTTEA